LVFSAAHRLALFEIDELSSLIIAGEEYFFLLRYLDSGLNL
jgi:hypothetical protein